MQIGKISTLVLVCLIRFVAGIFFLFSPTNVVEIVLFFKNYISYVNFISQFSFLSPHLRFQRLILLEILTLSSLQRTLLRYICSF